MPFFNHAKLFFLLCLGILFNSCQGYRFLHNENPLQLHGIKTMAVPMFVNLSIMPHVAGPFTQEIVKVLNKFSGLKIYPGESRKTDAICIGIISSVEHRSKLYKTNGQINIEDKEAESMGIRRPFTMSLGNTFNLDVKIIVIKNPTPQEIKTIQSSSALLDQAEKLNLGPEFLEIINHNPKILNSYSFTLNGSYTNQIEDTLSLDHGGVVNFTKSKDSREKAVIEMAKQAARNFEELVLNAY